jgi:hypothetical protein
MGRGIPDRGYRFAQSPANFCHPSGMKNGILYSTENNEEPKKSLNGLSRLVQGTKKSGTLQIF